MLLSNELKKLFFCRARRTLLELFLSCRCDLLGRRASAADVNHSQKREYESLNEAREKVEVDREHRRYAYLEYSGEDCENLIGKPTEDELSKTAESSVDERCENAAARNVTEMTEGEGDRLRDLGDDIHRRHYRNRLGKSLKPCAEAEVLYVVVPHHTGSDERPRKRYREVLRCRGDYLSHTDKGTEYR